MAGKSRRIDRPERSNRLLLAGGFAPPYLELPYDGQVMRPPRESLRRLLAAHQPNPALIVDGLWNLIEANPAASLLWEGVDSALLHRRSTCSGSRRTRAACRGSPR
jgi:MmyB-like transcription regulator ligand binding domain